MTRRLGGATLVAVMVVGAWLQAAAPSGRSAVADAAMRREVETVRTLLRQGADVNGAQGDGMTALHWAATHGDAELTEILLYGGANVKATSRLGRYTPLHVASQNGEFMGTAKVAIELAAELSRHDAAQVERMANSVLSLSPDYAELSRAHNANVGKGKGPK